MSLLVLTCCKSHHVPHKSLQYDQISRLDFNRFAVRSNLPVFWISDANDNKRIDPDEVAPLLLYPTSATWVDNGAFTSAFTAAYNQVVAAKRESAKGGELVPDSPDDPDGRTRRKALAQELDLGVPSLLRTVISREDAGLVRQLSTVAQMIEALYDRQTGAAELAGRVGQDRESRSVMRRNHGPQCVGWVTRENPYCSAIPGAPHVAIDEYPAAFQATDSFCAGLAATWIDPYTVIRSTGPVPYAVFYRDEATKIAAALEAAAAEAGDQVALAAYLRASAKGFRTNEWKPADAAASLLTPASSRWYARIGPGPRDWDPCRVKAGFRFTLARFHPDFNGSVAAHAPDFESGVAAVVGAPYIARMPRSELPDVADLVLAAGADRLPLGAVVVRRDGRNVELANLYSDADSVSVQRHASERLLDEAAMKAFSENIESAHLAANLLDLGTDLGPVEGGLLGDVKSEGVSLFLVDVLRERGVIDDQLARQTYFRSITRLLANTTELFDKAGARKDSPNATEIVIGMLVEHGALVWNEKGKTADHEDGALSLVFAKLPEASAAIVREAGQLIAMPDRKVAGAFLARFRDERVVPFGIIAHRTRTAPMPSFVYSVTP